ncbi:MAG TPA: peroxiredoxin [Gammaproteobacteria bacterium]|nr:peroxiredoxin [Gammaproteobacteria bacterium]
MGNSRKVKPGNKVPDFAAESTDGRFRLSEQRGRNLVLYFYPKDATPGCTREGQDFAANIAKFRRQRTTVLGVSRDSLASHEKFREKQGFPFHLLSDPEEKLCRLFDVIREKNMYGRKVMGIERSTFLIDAEGRLAREWRKVKVDGHAEEVLEAVRELNRADS